MKKNNPYQVICIGDECREYNNCENSCILKSTIKSKIFGCNYSVDGDCNHCSNKKKCILIKPHSKKLEEIESKRLLLQKENKKLYEYVNEWDIIEENLDKYKKNSVREVVYYKRNRQQMIDRINDNKRLINAYIKMESELINNMVS